jgi:uncharacterized protein (DUF924 family)
MSQAQAILAFWFGAPEAADYGQRRTVWFTKDANFDHEIRTRFGSVYEQAKLGELNHWQNSPETCLALILVLDQFPRNLFRNQSAAFATDALARKVARYALKQGYDQQLLPIQRWFVYLPFEHSEDLVDQQRSVALFSQLPEDANKADGLAYSLRHYEIIQQFGRFPHRNGILGRTSTAEEAAFLQRPEAWFG